MRPALKRTALAIGLIASLALTMALLSRRAARWEDRARVTVRQMAGAGAVYAAGHGEAVPNAFVLALANAIEPSAAVLPGTGTSVGDVRFRNRTVVEYRAMDPDAAARELLRPPDRVGGWECFGDLFLTPEFWTFAHGYAPDEDLVLAVTTRSGGRRMCFRGAGLTASSVTDDATWLAPQSDLRAKLGLPGLSLPPR